MLWHHVSNRLIFSSSLEGCCLFSFSSVKNFASKLTGVRGGKRKKTFTLNMRDCILILHWADTIKRRWMGHVSNMLVFFTNMLVAFANMLAVIKKIFWDTEPMRAQSGLRSEASLSVKASSILVKKTTIFDTCHIYRRLMVARSYHLSHITNDALLLSLRTTPHHCYIIDSKTI